MRHRLMLSVLSVLVAAASATAGESFVVDRGQSEVSFEVRHVTGPVTGAFTDFEGTVEYDPALPGRSSVEFRIRAASITTNNEKRDAHLRSPDFFDVETYPEIVFTSTKVIAKGASTFDVQGRLTMRGVTRDIVLPVSLVADAEGSGRRAGHLQDGRDSQPEGLQDHLEPRPRYRRLGAGRRRAGLDYAADGAGTT